MERTLPTWEEVQKHLPKSISLTYVDYRDDLHEHMDKIQECISAQAMDTLYEEVDEWYRDSKFESEDEAIKEIIGDVINDLDLDEDEDEEEIAEAIDDEYRDRIREHLWDVDDSDPIKDLLRNTSGQPMFVDTGHWITSEWEGGNAIEELRGVKKVLGIKAKDKTYDENILMMLCQAGSGQLLVYWYEDDFQSLMDTDSRGNAMTFTNPTIAVVSHSQGSGDHTTLDGLTVVLPFNSQNIFICKTVRYSYTYDVCGMIRDWPDSNVGPLLKKRGRKYAIEGSETAKHMDRERVLNATFKSGKCTFGDIKYTRHRKTTYINDFPCGTKCLDCGTFWID